MCIRNSRAMNPTRMPAPLASESSRILRDPAAGRRMVLGLRRRNRARCQNLPELARLPSPAVTGLRRFLARRASRQLTRRRRPGRAARRPRSTADGSRYLAVPAAPDVRSRSWRSKSSGFGTAARCSMDMQPSMPGGTARTNRMTQVISGGSNCDVDARSSRPSDSRPSESGPPRGAVRIVPGSATIGAVMTAIARR
jgi:hypothetical protein